MQFTVPVWRFYLDGQLVFESATALPAIRVEVAQGDETTVLLERSAAELLMDHSLAAYVKEGGKKSGRW